MADALFADVDKKVVKFVDFGVSKFARAPAPGVEDTKEGRSKIPEPNSVAGSPAYMAPELIDSSEKVVDEETGYACDCWSLGPYYSDKVFMNASLMNNCSHRCHSLRSRCRSFTIPIFGPSRVVPFYSRRRVSLFHFFVCHLDYEY